MPGPKRRTVGTPPGLLPITANVAPTFTSLRATQVATPRQVKGAVADLNARAVASARFLRASER